ncbi:LysM peptidoglycan-binding domain-containing protein [Virgibacillus alimentarius]|uniref:3D (Asp-Asp-Asp) domain-containing protein/LysM repeat protein n=1 Tax=Virgibacillus alimentarius TaxID=698769 RepID=A0ABS4S9L2_9BACI|nr:MULTISPECIES: 3D domain-containing protein [Virgibacillus]MBP2258193.1 3D (Asp-Asp-Asp) domain-containing protein/LysM repeat protein [Virgibacillus alimentarius]HLR68587.1 LysM peptidoglycan-binding domain-containing protein [Virgibacillus sp.]
MKKIVATIATGIIVAGAAATSVSAEQYEVKQGDNLWSIANNHNTTIDELMDRNGLHSTVIHPQQSLVVSGEGDAEKANTYTVKQGDTLSRIAKQFGVTVQNLKAWNSLPSDLIIVGQELGVNGAQASQHQNQTNQTAEVETEEPAVTEETQAAEASNQEQEPSEDQNQVHQDAEGQNAESQTTEEPIAEEVSTSSNENSNAEQASAAESDDQAESNESPEGKTISVSSTAYTASCNGCSGVTATGKDLNADPNAKVIAVDPNVIPLGSKVYVEGYGYATAADTGGAINGNKIDVHVPNKGKAYDWGVKDVNVTIVE